MSKDSLKGLSVGMEQWRMKLQHAPYDTRDGLESWKRQLEKSADKVHKIAVICLIVGIPMSLFIVGLAFVGFGIFSFNQEKRLRSEAQQVYNERLSQLDGMAFGNSAVGQRG